MVNASTASHAGIRKNARSNSILAIGKIFMILCGAEREGFEPSHAAVTAWPAIISRAE